MNPLDGIITSNPRPRPEFPGLHWDDDKQRYFSLAPDARLIQPLRPSLSVSSSSRPALSRTSSISRNTSAFKSNRPSVQSRAKLAVQPGERRKHLSRLRDRYSSQRRLESFIPVLASADEGQITALATCQSHPYIQAVGDSKGWVYTHGIPGDDSDTEHKFRPQLGLTSTISSISIEDGALLASSFGPSPKMFYRSLVPESTVEVVITPHHGVEDIRAVELSGTSCAVGAQRTAIYISSMERITPTFVPLKSDVFSLSFKEHLLYLGTRSGSVKMLDVRIPLPQQAKGDLLRLGQTIGVGGKTGSLVVGVKKIDEWTLMVAGTGNQLCTFDTRFLSLPGRTRPIMRFEGYVNAYLDPSPVVFDSSTATIIASCQDCYLRAWNAHTGTPILGNKTGTYGTRYADPVRALSFALDSHDEQSRWRTGVLVVGAGGRVERHVLD